MKIKKFEDLIRKIQKEIKIENLGQSISIKFDVFQGQSDKDLIEYKKLDLYESGVIQIRSFYRNDKKNYLEMSCSFHTENKNFNQMYQLYCILTNKEIN